MTAPPTIQTNPLDPVFSGVPVVIPQGNLVNPTWNKWFVDLREKVNVINSTLAAWSGITPSGITAGTYGDSTHYPVVTVNEFGLITGISEQAVSGGGGNPMKITTLTGDHTISPADAPATTANIGWLEQTASTSNVITIDTNANQNCPVGTHIFIRENTGGTTTINSVSGVTLSGPTITDGGNYSIGQVVQIALNSWAIFGNIPWSNYAFTPATWDSGKLASNVTRTSGTVLTNNATGLYNTCAGTLGKSSGKWIFITTCNGSNNYFSGIAAQQPGSSIPWINNRYLGYADLTNGESIGFENYNGQFHYSSQAASISGTSGASSGVANNVPLTLAVDLDSSPQTVKMFNGNTLLNSFNIPTAMAGFTWYPATSILYSGNTVTLNAGQSTITIPTPLIGLGYNPYWGT